MAVRVTVYGTAEMSQIEAAARQLEILKNKAAETSGGFLNSMSRLSDSASAAGDKLIGVGRDMSMRVTLPLVGVGTAAVIVAGNFEQSMAVLQQASGASAGEMAKLSEQAKTMGADMGFGANQAAQAMVELAKSGMTPAQISAGGLQATMAIAATEGLNLADSATITANALATFGLEAQDASKVADALAGGSNASSASVNSLAQALAQVGPGAVNAGLSINETVGVLSAFASKGIQGSDAGTSLKTMLMRLVPSSEEAAGAMEELGLKFTDANGSFLSISEVSQQLQDKLGGLTEAQKSQYLTTIFGSDATRAATVLMNEGAAGIGKFIDATNKQGAAQDLANARMDGMNGSMAKAKAAAENAGIALGTALEPVIVRVAGWVEKAANWFSKLDPAMQTNIATIGGVVAAMGPLLLIGGGTLKVFGGALSGIVGIGKAASATVTGIKGFVDGLTNAHGMVSSFATPAQNFGATIRNMGGAIASGAQAVGNFTVQLVKNAAQMAVTAAQWVASTAALVAQKVAQGAVAIAQGIATAAQWAWNVALTANPIGIIIVAIGALVAALVWFFTQTDLGRQIWQGFVDFIVGVWQGFVTWISNAVQVVVNWIGDHWQLLVGFLTGPIGLAITWVVSHWSEVSAWLRSALLALSSFWSGLWEGIGSFFAGIWNGIVSGVRSGIDKVVGFFQDLPGNIRRILQDAGTWLLNVGRDIVTGLWNGIKAGWTWLTDMVGNLVDGLVKGVKDALGIKSPSRVFAEIGGNVSAGMTQGILDGAPAVSKALNGLVSAGTAAVAGVALTAGVAMGGDIATGTAVSSSSRSVVVAEGAVQITFQGATDTADAQAVVQDAFAQLVRELRAS